MSLQHRSSTTTRVYSRRERGILSLDVRDGNLFSFEFKIFEGLSEALICQNPELLSKLAKSLMIDPSS